MKKETPKLEKSHDDATSNSTLKTLCMAGILFALCGCGAAKTEAEQVVDQAVVKQAIDSLDFRFEAERAYPTSYDTQFLTSRYDAVVSPDTFVVNLPYYGRAYTAPTNPLKGGFDFTTTDFDVRETHVKHKRYRTVTLKARDEGREITFVFNIWKGGGGDLVVTDPNRQPIRFSGKVTKRKK